MNTEENSPDVLFLDDESLAADILRQNIRREQDIGFRHYSNFHAAMAAADLKMPTVILVDLRMPEIDGLEAIRRFRNNPHLRQVPIVLLSSEDCAEIKARAFAEGANDYLVKWPDRRELVARIRYHSNAYLAHKQRDDAFLSLRKSQQELLARTKELAESQAALQHAQKMEAIGQLTGGIAHDFNNVLQVISGNLQILKLLNKDSESAQKRIGAAIEGVERGAKLASHLLAFARRQPLQAMVVNLGGILKNMEELLHRSLGSAVAIETRLAGDLWNIAVDPSQFENAILNLAINARDAMGGAGKLTLGASNLPAGYAGAARMPDRDGDQVLIEVCDTGSGMSPDILSRAFEPFFTTKPLGQGTGLGLSMAYGFVKQSGGHIGIESEPGKGTTVRILLPRASAAAEAPPGISAEPMLGGAETILVVEDEADVRATTVELLSNLGYLVLQAENGEAALRVIESGIPIDLLFTDVVMPGHIRSADLADRARACLPGMRVLFTSGYSEGELAHGGRLAAGITLLRKPYTIEELARQIRHLLRRKVA